MIEIATAILPAVTAFLGVVATQLFARRKTSAETHKTEAEARSIEVDTRLKLDNIAENITVLQRQVQDLDSRTARVEKQVANAHVTNLREDIDSLAVSQKRQGATLNEVQSSLEKFIDWVRGEIKPEREVENREGLEPVDSR